jgi:hypothetical protein
MADDVLVLPVRAVMILWTTGREQYVFCGMQYVMKKNKPPLIFPILKNKINKKSIDCRTISWCRLVRRVEYGCRSDRRRVNYRG